MKLEGAKSNFYDQDKDYSFRSPKRASVQKQYDMGPVVPDFMNKRTSKGSRVRTNKDGDIAEFKTAKTEAEHKKERIQKRKQAEIRRKKAAQQRVKAGIAALITATAIAGGTKGCVSELTKFNPASTNFDALGHTITEVSDWTGVDEKAILLANQLESADEKVDDIVLPESYKPLEESITTLQEKLSQDKLSAEEKEELQQELDFLSAKQKEQDEMGEAYIDEDGKFVYIVPNETVAAEAIKDAYGIEDGILKDYNNLSYTWGFDSNLPEDNGYRDYTSSRTSGVRIPADEINKFDED